MGYVYLILQVDESGNETYKLGFTKNHPDSRVKQLSTGNPNKISLLNFYTSENYKKVEFILHKKCSGYKTISKNEWLHLPNEIILNFKKECEKIDDVVKILKKENCFYK